MPIANFQNMGCRLIQNIKHTCEYNAGGISSIYLLDIRDFISYRFKDDKLYNQCLVEDIKKADSRYIRLDTVSESHFTESQENGLYKQQLTTFVRSIDHIKTADLLLANSNKYLFIFQTSQGKAYTFGSDGGASVNFSQQSGQFGEVAGYNMTVDKNSIYPLFEINFENLFLIKLLGTEKHKFVSTEDGKAILIK